MKYMAKLMKRSLRLRILTFSAVIVSAILFPPTLKGQARSYTAENVNYALVLPSPEWRAINVPGIGHDDTEFRYGNHSAVQMRIRRELVDAAVPVPDLIQRQQQMDRSLFLGYVKEKVEPFTGHLSGARYAYEYVADGAVKGRLVYYLEANNRVVYRLEFAGSPEDLRNLSEQTDLIARSFRLK